MPTTTYAGNKLLDLLFRGVAFTAPTRVYVSLHTADPALTGANEVTTVAWPAYVRMDPANGGAVGGGFDAAASRATQNAQQMLWPAHNGASDVIVTHIAIWDAATAGNCLHTQVLTSARTIKPADEFVFNLNQLDITVT